MENEMGAAHVSGPLLCRHLGGALVCCCISSQRHAVKGAVQPFSQVKAREIVVPINDSLDGLDVDPSQSGNLLRVGSRQIALPSEFLSDIDADLIDEEGTSASGVSSGIKSYFIDF